MGYLHLPGGFGSGVLRSIRLVELLSSVQEAAQQFVAVFLKFFQFTLSSNVFRILGSGGPGAQRCGLVMKGGSGNYTQDVLWVF